MTLIIKTANYAEDFLIGKVWSEKEISRSAYEHIKKISSPLLPESYKSANVSFARPISTGIQQFHVSTDDRVDKPEMHSAADIQISDEAMYTDDLPTPICGLQSAFVISLKPRATILSTDLSEVKKSLGFVAYFCAADIDLEYSKIGHIVVMGDSFSICEVFHAGQVIGIVVADTHKNANLAAEKMKLEYQVGKPEMHSAADIQVSDEAMCTGDLPTPIDGLHSAFVISLKVSCLPTHALVLTVAGQMFSWAKGDDGSLGLGSLATRNSLSKILGLEDVRVVQVDTLPRLNSSTEIYWQRRIYIKSPVHKLQKKK
eukprot:444239_1